MSVTVIRSAKAVVLDARSRALLLRRSGTHPEFAHDPDLPGGTMLPDEAYEKGIVRELLEETGIELSQMGGIHRLYMGSFYEPGEESMTERLLFGIRLRDNTPEIRLSSEHDQYEWIAKEDLQGIEEPYQGGIRYVNLFDLWEKIA